VDVRFFVTLARANKPKILIIAAGRFGSWTDKTKAFSPVSLFPPTGWSLISVNSQFLQPKLLTVLWTRKCGKTLSMKVRIDNVVFHVVL
jgi:hypothetical protein